MASLTEVRLRTKLPADWVKQNLVQRNPTPGEWDIMLTGPAKVLRPDGKPLAIYLPGYMAKHTADEPTAAILDAMGKAGTTANRGMASATLSLRPGTQNRSYSVPIYSNVMGSVDAMSIYKFCRLTTWTAEHLGDWDSLRPLFGDIAAAMSRYVPDRYAAQQAAANTTNPAYVIPGTPFSTITVNHSYATGVHTDKGDLEAGYSSIFCMRQGDYAGGQLCFPQYRVAVDLQDGDLILMDAHDYHGNAKLYCGCSSTQHLMGPCKNCGAGRVSVVTYFRTKLTECDNPEAELAKARDRRELKV